MKKNLSRQEVRLFDFSETTSHGIPALHFLFLFLFSVTIPFSTAQSATDPSQNAYGGGFQGGLNPSMTVVIVVLVCAFFFIGFFAVYLRHCTQSRSAAVPLNPRVTAGGGLDPELIEAFPIVEYSAVKDLKIGKAPLECAVCLNEFEDDESLRLLPICDHVFHPDCIDEWLASHITCPVCRTNLTAENGEIAGNLVLAPDSNELLSEPKLTSELGEERNHVSINIPKDQTVEIGGTSQTLKQNRPPRSRSTRTGRFPRSHSTGHSLVQPGESFERYTLRLPDEVRKQIAMTSKLNRTRSHGVVLPRVGSSRRGYRSGGEGSGRFDRWVFTMAPPFLLRGGSVKSPKMGGYGDVTPEGGGNNAKTFLTSVKAPLDCLAAKDDGGEHSSARPQI